MKNNAILIVSFFAILISACSAVKNTKATNNLGNAVWELEYISGSRIAFEGLYPNKKPKITFNTTTNNVSGTSSWMDTAQTTPQTVKRFLLVNLALQQWCFVKAEANRHFYKWWKKSTIIPSKTTVSWIWILAKYQWCDSKKVKTDRGYKRPVARETPERSASPSWVRSITNAFPACFQLSFSVLLKQI